MTKSSRPTFGRLLRSLLATSALVVAAQTASVHAASAAQTLTIESWRNDDAESGRTRSSRPSKANIPGHQGRVHSRRAPTEYNAALNAKLDGGTAGDLITCRPFDASLELFKKGNLVAVNDLPGMENFSDVAKSAWTTDDGKTTFCVPMASVIHGFIYNKDDLRRARPDAAEDRWTSSTPSSTRSRPTAPTSRWPWAPPISGKPPPWASRTSARTTGRARKAARR